jgi:hypothetical protein
MSGRGLGDRRASTCRIVHGIAGACAGINRAAGSPRSTARSTARLAEYERDQASTTGHGAATSADSTSAGTRSRSSSRARLSAHQPSVAFSMRVAPPTDTAPARVRPESAARSPSSAAASTRSRVPARALSNSRTNPAARATVAGWPVLCSSGPSARPVRAIAPEAAQSVAASVGVASTATPPLDSAAGPSSSDTVAPSSRSN